MDLNFKVPIQNVAHVNLEQGPDEHFEVHIIVLSLQFTVEF